MALLILSLAANIAITLVVSLGIWRNHPGISEVYGADTPARRILGTVYLTIGLISLYALAQLVLGHAGIAWDVALTLLPLQIIYKVMTAVALRPTHPVVLANLGVAGLHFLTILLA